MNDSSSNQQAFDVGEIATLNKPSSERHGEDCEVVGPLQLGQIVHEEKMDVNVNQYAYRVQFAGEKWSRFALPSELKKKPPFVLPKSVTEEREEEA